MYRRPPSLRKKDFFWGRGDVCTQAKTKVVNSIILQSKNLTGLSGTNFEISGFTDDPYKRNKKNKEFSKGGKFGTEVIFVRYDYENKLGKTFYFDYLRRNKRKTQSDAKSTVSDLLRIREDHEIY